MSAVTIKERSSSGTSIIPLDADLLSTRKIFITGEITHETADNFLKSIMKLISTDETSPIKVIIDSPGGEVDSGLMIYDIIQSSETPIEIYCTGIAYSMAAVLFLSGTPGNRFILPNSKVMIHSPLVNNFGGGNTSSVEELSKSLKNTKRKLDSIISTHTGKKIKDIEKATSKDTFFDANEAIEYGIADKIIGITELCA